MAIAPTSVCAVITPVPIPNPLNGVMPLPAAPGPIGDTGVPRPEPVGVDIMPAPNPYGSVGERLEIVGAPAASPPPNGERVPGDIGVWKNPDAGNGVVGH